MITNKTDNSLIQLFLPIIQNQLVLDGFTDVNVKQSNQPTMQGINNNPTVYFFKLANKRYGFLGRYDKWDADLSRMVHHENQYYESTWQVSALVLQYPTDINLPTASDLVNDVASIMQSDNTRSILNQSGVGILRVTDVSNPYFFDDKDNFEASPNFDFTLVYENTRINYDPIISAFNVQVSGV